ncbi:MAG: outer membrane protein assembly factor BamC [Halopseudomonas sp.]
MSGTRRLNFSKEIIMKPVLGALSVVLLGSLSGCGYIYGEDGYFRDRGSDYQAAQIKPRMEVPDGIESKPIGDLLPVPGQVTGNQEFDKFEMPRPQPMLVSAEASEFSLQQDGAKRWVHAQRSPADTWPLVRQFWNDYQVGVASESANLGEVETDWLAFDVQSDNPLVRRISPALGEGRSEEDEHRFRMRVEPGVQSGSSEIFILHTHRSQGGNRDEWPEKSDNLNLERAVLAELESYLSQSRADGSTSLVASQEGLIAQRATLDQDGAGNAVLNIQSDFNRTWAAVGDALGQADILVTDLDRSSGVYYVDLDETASSQQEKPGFFGRLFGRDVDEEVTGRPLQVRLTQVSNGVQVTVQRSIETAAEGDEAQALLTRIRDNLN